MTAWLTCLVTVRCFLKRGVDATDEQYVTIEQDAKEARDEILEAANGDGGLFDLPLRGNTTTTGVSRADRWATASDLRMSRAISGATWAVIEDSNSGGTYG